ncbi:MAG TPA: hypothetical protein VHR64_12565 [Thermomicrobiales bacterium]|nr:hypothetical protein [Thermomicrobiales bacterium]
MALIALGVVVHQGGFAQDDYSTPPATTGGQDGYTTPAAGTNSAATDAKAEASLQYLSFIKAIAANLGVSDPMTVDSGIRTMLKQVVDDRHNAGEISDSAASSLDAQIDAGNVAPLIFGQPGQTGASASGNDPSDTGAQQGDDNNTQQQQQAPTETPDSGDYDYGY